MANDAFVAFWAGVCCGMVFGVMMTAVLAAVSNKIEGSEEK